MILTPIWDVLVAELGNPVDEPNTEDPLSDNPIYKELVTDRPDPLIKGNQQ